MRKRGLSILIGITPQLAFELAQQQMGQVIGLGGVHAAVADLEANYGRKLTEDEIKITTQAMTLGMTMGYVILGQNLAAVEEDMRKHGIDPAKIGQAMDAMEQEALANTEGEHEAERKTSELLARVSKPTLH